MCYYNTNSLSSIWSFTQTVINCSLIKKELFCSYLPILSCCECEQTPVKHTIIKQFLWNHLHVLQLVHTGSKTSYSNGFKNIILLSKFSFKVYYFIRFNSYAEYRIWIYINIRAQTKLYCNNFLYKSVARIRTSNVKWCHISFFFFLKVDL